jgi:hypothetical protein
VHLKEPAAIVATLDVNGVVEISRSFSVDCDNGKFAKIFAALAIGITDRMSHALTFLKDIGRKGVGQVMLADDDFGVHAEIAGTTDDFNDAAGGSGATATIMKKLGIDDSAVQLGDMRKAFAAARLFFFGELKLFAESGGEFFAGN